MTKRKKLVAVKRNGVIYLKEKGKRLPPTRPNLNILAERSGATLANGDLVPQEDLFKPQRKEVRKHGKKSISKKNTT